MTDEKERAAEAIISTVIGIKPDHPYFLQVAKDLVKAMQDSIDYLEGSH